MHTRNVFLSILVIAFTSFTLTAQVGVNNPTPEQTLDVSGKLKITDDATPPTDGTLRFNDGAQDFEGYSEGEWKSLTKSAAADNPVPVALAHFGIDNTGVGVADFEPFNTLYNYTNSNPTNGTTNTIIPIGKFLVIDQICVTQDGGLEDTYFRASVRPTVQNGSNQQVQNPQIMITGSLEGGTTCVEAERAPLLVVKGGGTIYGWNSAQSGGNVRIMTYGFIVDNLDQYFGY